MKKGLTHFVTLMLVVGITIGCVSIVNAKSLKLTLANNSPVGESRDLVSKKFAELVKEKTNGEVQVEVFSGGALGSWREAIEGLKPAIVNVVIESVGSIAAYTKFANIDAVPFLYRDPDHFKKVWFSDLGTQIMDRAGKEGGFMLLGPMYRGARYVTSTKKIVDANDLSGFKIRVPSIKIYMDTWNKLGAISTPMNFTEVYTGIQQGTVNGQENPLQACYAAALYEVCPYLIMTKHVYSVDTFIFDRQFFEGIPDKYQTAIQEAANEAGVWRTEYEQKTEDEILKKFEEKGVTLVNPNIETFRERVQGLVKEEFPELEELVERIKAIQ